MSECPRAHSDQSKARIGIALRRIWGERLKQKRLQEKCYLEWAESIAEEARKGGHGQQELEWDSYEKMKVAIILEQLRRVAEKAKAKELEKSRAEELAKAKADRKANIVKGKKEADEMKRKLKNAIKKNTEMKSKEKEELAISRKLKIKARLSKFHQKMDDQKDSSIGMEPNLEKWDMEFVKRERVRRSVSLADQIQAANHKKAEFSAKETLKTTTSDALIPREEG